MTLAPGNSGGPLLNAQGEVVGINAMIFGGDLSVAIPADVASQFVAVALAEVPPFGIEVQPIRLPKAVQAATNYQQGLMIIGVQAGSIASAAGLYVGDVLLDVFDTPLHDLHTLKYALVGRHNGKPLRLRYARGEHIGSITV